MENLLHSPVGKSSFMRLAQLQAKKAMEKGKDGALDEDNGLNNRGGTPVGEIQQNGDDRVGKAFLGYDQDEIAHENSEWKEVSSPKRGKGRQGDDTAKEFEKAMASGIQRAKVQAEQDEAHRKQIRKEALDRASRNKKTKDKERNGAIRSHMETTSSHVPPHEQRAAERRQVAHDREVAWREKENTRRMEETQNKTDQQTVEQEGTIGYVGPFSLRDRNGTREHIEVDRSYMVKGRNQSEESEYEIETNNHNSMQAAGGNASEGKDETGKAVMIGKAMMTAMGSERQRVGEHTNAELPTLQDPMRLGSRRAEIESANATVRVKGTAKEATEVTDAMETTTAAVQAGKAGSEKAIEKRQGGKEGDKATSVAGIQTRILPPTIMRKPSQFFFREDEDNNKEKIDRKDQQRSVTTEVTAVTESPEEAEAWNRRVAEIDEKERQQQKVYEAKIAENKRRLIELEARATAEPVGDEDAMDAMGDGANAGESELATTEKIADEPDAHKVPIDNTYNDKANSPDVVPMEEDIETSTTPQGIAIEPMNGVKSRDTHRRRHMVIRTEFKCKDNEEQQRLSRMLTSWTAQLWAVEKGIVFRSTKDRSQVIRQMTEFPANEEAGREFFDILVTHFGNEIKTTVLCTIESCFTLDQLKQDGRLFRYLREHNIFMYTHAHGSIGISSVGWHSEMKPRLVDLHQTVIDITDELTTFVINREVRKGKLITRNEARALVPTMEMGITKVRIQLRDRNGRATRRYRLEALELKCESLKTDCMRNLIFDATVAGEFSRRRFGVFVPYQAKAHEQVYKERLDAHEQFLQKLVIIPIFALHDNHLKCMVPSPSGEVTLLEKMLNATYESRDREGVMVHSRILRTFERTRNTETIGKWLLTGTADGAQAMRQLIDTVLIIEGNATEAQKSLQALGEPYTRGIRRPKVSGDRIAEYINAIQVSPQADRNIETDYNYRSRNQMLRAHEIGPRPQPMAIRTAPQMNAWTNKDESFNSDDSSQGGRNRTYLSALSQYQTHQDTSMDQSAYESLMSHTTRCEEEIVELKSHMEVQRSHMDEQTKITRELIQQLAGNERSVADSERKMQIQTDTRESQVQQEKLALKQTINSLEQHIVEKQAEQNVALQQLNVRLEQMHVDKGISDGKMDRLLEMITIQQQQQQQQHQQFQLQLQQQQLQHQQQLQQQQTTGNMMPHQRNGHTRVSLPLDSDSTKHTTPERSMTESPRNILPRKPGQGNTPPAKTAPTKYMSPHRDSTPIPTQIETTMNASPDSATRHLMASLRAAANDAVSAVAAVMTGGMKTSEELKPHTVGSKLRTLRKHSMKTRSKSRAVPKARREGTMCINQDIQANEAMDNNDDTQNSNNDASVSYIANESIDEHAFDDSIDDDVQQPRKIIITIRL